jgi:para-nitrobenzyl esterase
MKSVAVGCVVGLAALIAASTVMGASRNDGAIVTESGPLEGIAGGQINAYLGIPYATPPVGPLRWIPPQPFGRWQGVYRATAFGNECPQQDTAGEVIGDEDCLFLNIYTPSLKKKQNKHAGLAVMVWIHGGGLTSGAGSEFDPTPLVEGGGVIVVTLNYRLGVLGFFAHSALDNEGHLAGNYGFMDQQFALAWVQRNIAAFGGDPSRMTIFGESAGGLSVYSQLASPLAAGLFQGAIAQSGAYGGFAPDYRAVILPIAEAETTGNLFVDPGTTVADRIGCTSQTAACLRDADAATIVTAQGFVFPFIDGMLLTQTPGAAFTSGNFNRVPVITGTNHDEYRFFVARDFIIRSGLITSAGYSAVVQDVFGPTIAPSVETAYPAGAPPFGPSLELAAAGTDGIFACTARRAMMAVAHYVTTFAYEFNDENAPSPFPNLNFPLGAFHSADVQYLFNRNGVPAPFTPAQAQLSQTMIAYWTQFAKTGNPNALGQPVWDAYDPTNDLRQSLVPPTPVVESGFATDHLCAFWEAF